MNFQSLPFLALLGLTFAAYWTVKAHKQLRLGVMLFASALFYIAFDYRALLLFCWYAVVNFVCARLMKRAGSLEGRQAWMVAGVVHHLAILCLFKYTNMLLDTWEPLAQRLGFPYVRDPLGILLPVGLSFVTFQAISYVVDVYRGDFHGDDALHEQLLYLLFFPHVVAGPIFRAKDLLGRFDETPTLVPEEGLRALHRIAMGIAKKALIADVLAAGIVDRVYANPEHYTSAECAIGVIAYTMQIYFDFSGYSDVVLGAIQLFGFKLPDNFNKPYHARNLFEFWNRWHLSLSTWLRDYLYIPLGGNRTSKPKALRNLMVVMVLGGLWHGADWRFALWGAIHGVLLVLIRLWWWRFGKPKTYALPAHLTGIVVTFVIVALTRVFFRATDVGNAWDMFVQLAQFTGGLANVSLLTWAAFVGAFVTYYLPPSAYELSARVFERAPAPVRAAALVGLALVIKQLSDIEVQPYIYFQF